MSASFIPAKTSSHVGIKKKKIPVSLIFNLIQVHRRVQYLNVGCCLEVEEYQYQNLSSFDKGRGPPFCIDARSQFHGNMISFFFGVCDNLDQYQFQFRIDRVES